MAFSHIIIIYNPNSTGPSRKLAEQLAADLAGYPAPVELLATKHPGHAEELGRQLAAKYNQPLIVSSSGDGAYHELINGVMTAVDAGHLATAAVLPAGNGNDHRRVTARAPLAESIRADRTTTIDLLHFTFRRPDGRTTTRYAHSYAGIGLTPVVAAELNRHSLNALRELIIVVRAFAQFRPVTIRTGGRTARFDSLIFSNINEMAKALKVSQTGRPNDGQFELTAFPAGSKLALLCHLIRAVFGGLHADQRLRQYEFELVKPTPIQLDGEVTPLGAGTTVTVRIAPRALQTVL